MFRFGLFFPLVMANVLISSQIAAEFDISNALTETLINEDFIRPVAANAPDSAAGYMKFDDIASKDHFWAVSTLVVAFGHHRKEDARPSLTFDCADVIPSVFFFFL